MASAATSASRSSSSPGPPVELAEAKPSVAVDADMARANSDTSESVDEPRPHLHAKTFLAVTSVLLIYFAQLLTLVGAGAQGQTIAGHFGGTANVVWFSAPITILTVVLGPIVSQAADYWGRRWLLIILTLFGAAGCVIVARAGSMNMAIAGFSVIGISFGAQPLLHAVTSEVLPRRWRGHGQAATMASNCLGSICGLLVGGALNRANDPASNGFRTYFYMCTGAYVVAPVLTFLAYNPPETALQREFRGRTGDKLRMLDWVGYVLLAAGLVLFCVGLSYSQNPYPWSDPHVAATFAVGLFLAFALVLYETYVKKDGMFHHGLFNGNRNFAIAVVCILAEGVAFFAANIYFAFQVSVLYETDALIVSTRYSIMLICAMVGALVTGVYSAVTRQVRWITVLAFLIFVAFFAAMATTDRTTNTPVWGYPVLMGIGLGITLTTLVTVAQLSTPPELIAIASGLVISVRSLGGTIGLAISNALFTSEMKHMPENIASAVLPLGLDPDKLPAFIGALSAHNMTALLEITTSESIIQSGTFALLDTFAAAFRNVWIAAACFVAVAAVLAAFLYDPKKEFTMHVDAPVEKEEDLYSI